MIPGRKKLVLKMKQYVSIKKKICFPFRIFIRSQGQHQPLQDGIVSSLPGERILQIRRKVSVCTRIARIEVGQQTPKVQDGSLQNVSFDRILSLRTPLSLYSQHGGVRERNVDNGTAWRTKNESFHIRYRSRHCHPQTTARAQQPRKKRPSPTRIQEKCRVQRAVRIQQSGRRSRDLWR